MFDKFVQTILFEIVKYLQPLDFVKLTLLSKSLNITLKGDLFWSLRFVSQYGKVPISELKPQEQYKQKYTKKKQKVFTKELGGYHVSQGGQSKEINISCLFEDPKINEEKRHVPKNMKKQFKVKKQITN